MLEVGRNAPSFSLPSTSGANVSLDGLRGKKVVLYFYPKDDTPGCTVEACDFRDNLARVRAAGAQVYGVSKDSLGSHAKFRGKYALPFELLSDADNAVARAYGAYGKKKMYGKDVQGTIRSTFLIDERGRIARVWSPVKVQGHVDRVLEALAGESVARSESQKASGKSSPAKDSPAKARAAKAKTAHASDSAARATKRTARTSATASAPKSIAPRARSKAASTSKAAPARAGATSGRARARRSGTSK